MIRRATPADIETIARVHVQAWEETYRGMVPDAAFEDHSLDVRLTQWRAIVGNVAILVRVAEISEGICGFASGGKARPGLPAEAEIYSLYVLDAVKRRGIGSALMLHLRDALAAASFRTLGLWTLANNTRARRFYEAMGGRAGETRIDRRSNLAYEDISYIWDDISRMGRA
jgi:ribosomal protein S18 acetylase RimI-like enzyme